MKKIITAMGNNKLADELEKIGILEIVTKDIPYTEGVIEVLEEIPNIDIVIISELLYGQMDFKETIKRILEIDSSIDVIVFVEQKTPEMQSFLFSNGVYKIYENNEIDIDTFIRNIIGVNVSSELSNINNDIAKTEEKYHLEEQASHINLEANGRVFAITGPYNAGKSMLAYDIGKIYEKQDLKILIIDFDIYTGSMDTIFHIPKYNNQSTAFNIKGQVVRINKNISVLCAMDLLFNNDNTVDYVNLEELIKEFRVLYDVILIDTSSDYKYKYLNRILNVSDVVIFVTVPNKLELKKAYYLFEILMKDFKIDKNKMRIVLNKVTKSSIPKEEMSKLFCNIEVTSSFDFDLKREEPVNITIDEVIGG